MKLGIYSDIHANYEALEAVLSAYAAYESPIERFVCLGDIVGYGASPNECCERVREHASVVIIGNHDAAVCGRMDYSYYYEAARRALNWHANQLIETHHQWLRTLPYRCDWEGVTFCHGSPIRCENFDYVLNESQASELIKHWDTLQHVTFIGHSHLTKSFELSQEGAREITGSTLVFEADKKYVVTVGSVGQPRDNDNRSCFCIYDTETLTLEYHRVPYDIQKAANRIFESELSSDFAKRLFFGI